MSSIGCVFVMVNSCMNRNNYVSVTKEGVLNMETSQLGDDGQSTIT